MAKLKDVEISDYLKECVDLLPELLSEEFARMSADYAYWNERYAEANRRELSAEWERDRTYAATYLRRKLELEEAGKKAPEATVDAEVRTSKEYGAAVEAHIEAKAEREHLRGVLEALRTKREMLVSAGAHQRQEMQGDVAMRDRAALKRAERDF
jgi:hypothetical protein